MTFLPIVERELRVAARRTATHWTRSCAALATLTIWVLLALSTPRESPESCFCSVSGTQIICSRIRTEMQSGGLAIGEKEFRNDDRAG